MYKRQTGVKFRDRWLASAKSVSDSSSGADFREFSGARSSSPRSSPARRRVISRSRSTSGSSDRSPRTKRKRRLSSSGSSDSTSESGPRRKRIKTKRKPIEEEEEDPVFKLRDMIEITGHPKTELNGICGLLEYWVSGKGLWIVRVAGNLLKQTLKIKPKFMKKVTSEEAKAAMEKIKESKEKQKQLNALLKTRLRSGLERAKSKDEESQNNKAKVLADFGVRTNGKRGTKDNVSEKVSLSVAEKVITKSPLDVEERPGIVVRKPEGVGPPATTLVPPLPFQPYTHSPSQLQTPYVGGLFPPPMVPFGMQAPGVQPYPHARVPYVGTTITSVPEKGKRPLIPTLPMENPPMKPLETNLEEEIMDQGPDSDEEVMSEGPTAPPPNLTEQPIYEAPIAPFIMPPLGPPPMKPPTPQNTKDPIRKRKSQPSTPRNTDTTRKRKSRFKVSPLNNDDKPTFQKPSDPLSEQHLSNVAEPKPNAPPNILMLSPPEEENCRLEEKKTPEPLQSPGPSTNQRGKMTFEFKTLKSPRLRKKMSFSQEKPKDKKPDVNKQGGEVIVTQVIEKPTIVSLDDMKKSGKETERKQEEEDDAVPASVTSDAIKDRINQINAELIKKKREQFKKKEQESKKQEVEHKSMSRSESKIGSNGKSFSRSWSNSSSSISKSRSRGTRRKRRDHSSSESRSRSYSSRSRSRSYSRSSSSSSRSRSSRRRRRRRRRSSSYSTSSYY